MLYFLIIYIIFLLCFVAYSAAGIYHLQRFGYVGDLTRPAIYIYIALSSIVIIISILLILTYSWPAGFQV